MVKLLVFTGEDPTMMYYEALVKLQNEGEKVSPRGKDILELRPVTFEFTNPANRVTFLRKRGINPFFQLAESIWILLGRSDVELLKGFNSNIAQFSDDGKYFNAPYGERLMNWGKNDASGFIFNPINQLYDAARKLKEDKDTRQAVAIMYNPLFDNSDYTIDEKGKDVPCNLVLLFKVRNESLDLTVFNRSNDISWGLFGANIVQFTTILELMSCALGVKMGTYTHITDSLHAYTSDYSWKINDVVLSNNSYGNLMYLSFPDEPRMSTERNILDSLEYFDNRFEAAIMNDEWFIKNELNFYRDVEATGGELSCNLVGGVKDPYFADAFAYMAAYRMHKLGFSELCMRVINSRPASQWKVSCLSFMNSRITVDLANEYITTGETGLSQEIVDFVRGE